MNASHIRLYYKISDKLIGFEINKKHQPNGNPKIEELS